MSFADDPNALLRTPRQFAARVIGEGPRDDLEPDLRRLLGSAKGVFLQYFDEVHGIEVARFDFPAARAVRQVEDHLFAAPDAEADLLLVSHYLTFVEDLDESADTSDELDPEEAQERVLYAIEELLARLARWARDNDRQDLQETAELTNDEFSQALARI